MMRTAIVVLAAAAALQAQSRPKPPDPGWVSLFNGKDLTGWVKVGNEKWEVVDGVIHGQGITKEYGYLRTEKKYTDFHMSLRFNARPTATAACSSTWTSSPAPPMSPRDSSLKSTGH
jgi:Domain of Unknown Function (DUF1080).